MPVSAKGEQGALIVALLSIVATQIIYFALSHAGADINRTILWGLEAVLFGLIAVVALSLVGRAAVPLAMSAIALGGVLNIVQLGMGLAMFGPLSEGGDALAPAFKAVLGGAFFLYFAGKAMFGFAAAALAFAAYGAGGPMHKGLAVLAGLAGLAALAVNAVAMATGMDLAIPAGATGTVATVLLALLLAGNGRIADPR